jgi:hypothetical protein
MIQIVDGNHWVVSMDAARKTCSDHELELAAMALWQQRRQEKDTLFSLGVSKF